MKKGLVGENGFGNEPKESWFPVRDSTPNEPDPGNEFPETVFDPTEKLEPALLTAYNEDVILSTECFKKLVDGATETLFATLTV